LPKIGSIITLAATGSENNSGGVMTNPKTNEKLGFGHPEAKPVFCYEDPTILFNLPKYQRQAGVCDIISHLLEQYFGTHTDDMISDRMIEAMLKNIIANYESYISENDYNAHANIFITSSLALNGLTSIGKEKTD
jgi:butanol dehydrogenase